MADLPFLVVHGAMVWKAGVLGAGAASVKAAAWMRNRASGRFVRKATQHYTDTATGLEAGPILVRGRLRGGGAQSFEHGWNAVIHNRDAGTYIDIEGERIDFAGEVVVGCGSENRTGYWKHPEGAPIVDNPDLQKRGPQRLSIVREGDEVLVAGVLRRAAAGDADYRDNAGGWKIEPFPRQGAVGLVAQQHKARALPASPAKIVGTFTLWAMVALVGMRACGAIDDSPRGHGPSAIHDLSVAAAMPGTRDDALDTLDRVLIDGRTPQRIDQAIALREMQHGCSAAIELMLDESRLDDALAASRRCGDTTHEASTLVLLGRYGEAAKIHADNLDADSRELIALATGNYADAASIDSDTCANAFYTSLAKHTPMPDHSSRCELLATQLLPPASRATFAANLSTYSDDAQLSEALVDLDSAHQVYAGEDFERAGRDLLAGPNEDASLLVWTSRPGDITPARAVFETYRGDFDKAQQIAGQLIVQATDTPHLAQAQFFAAAIAIRTGRTVPPAWLLADKLPSGSVFRDDDLGAPFMIARGQEPSLARGAYALASAMRGDGTGLNDEYNELGLTDAVKLIAVLPKVNTKGRGEAVDFMRALRGETLTATRGPMHIIRTAALRRDLAAATGDAEGAASWQGVVDRHIAVLANRDLLLGFLVRPSRD
jgi:hypothetical protein